MSIQTLKNEEPRVAGHKIPMEEPDSYSFDSHSKYTSDVIKYYFHMASFNLSADESSQEIAKTLEHYRELDGIQNTFTYENPFTLIGELWRKVTKKKLEDDGDDGSMKRDQRTAKAAAEIEVEKKRKITVYHLKLLDLIIFCLSISTLIKLCTLAYFHHRYDMALDADKPMVSVGANRTSKCALKSDIYFQDPINHKRLEELTKWLEFIGDSVINSFGASTILYGTIGASVLLYYVMPILLMGPRRIRIDLVSFIMDPKLERLRINYELAIVIRSLVSSALDYSKALEKKLVNSIHANLGKEEAQRRQNLQRMKSSHRAADIRLPERRTLGDQEIRKFIKMLLDDKLMNLIRPTTLTSRWYNITNFASPVFLISHNLIAHCVTWLVQWALIVGNLLARTQQKLDFIECKLWHKEAVVIESTNFLHSSSYQSLEKFSLSESENGDMKAYLSHDGSVWNLMRLAFLVESKSFFTAKITVEIVFIMLTTLASTAWASLYFWLHFSIHIEKLAWINQILNQIAQCSRLLEQQQQHEMLQKKLDKKMAHEQCDDYGGKMESSPLFYAENEERYKHGQLIEEITVCYLNFELFRRQQRNYQKLASFTSVQATMHAAVCLILSYFVGSNLSIGKSGMILFMSTYMVVFVNIFLVCDALLISRIHKLMKCAIFLVARCAQSSVESSYALQLWRRQTLYGKEDLKKLYAPHIFGMLISFETVVSFNFYLAFTYMVVLLKVDR